jgi:hypothetical protein
MELEALMGMLPPQSIGEPLREAGFGNSPTAQKVKEKVDQLWTLQALLQQPLDLDLRTQYLDSSSTAVEVDARKNEIRYQIKLLQALLAMLSDELKLLEQSGTSG